jgi:steroid delta-isomerase-like uncharacterized protein
MTTEANVRRAKELTEAFNRYDRETVFSAYGDQAVLTDHALQQTLSGRDEIAGYWQQVFDASSDQRFDVADVIGAGDWTVVRGVNGGTADGPWAGMEPTNRPYEISMCILSRWEDGKIAELHAYYDMYALLVQMGLAPAMTESI